MRPEKPPLPPLSDSDERKLPNVAALAKLAAERSSEAAAQMGDMRERVAVLETRADAQEKRLDGHLEVDAEAHKQLGELAAQFSAIERQRAAPLSGEHTHPELHGSAIGQLVRQRWLPWVLLAAIVAIFGIAAVAFVTRQASVAVDYERVPK